MKIILIKYLLTSCMMASEEHKQLASFVKSVHSALRKSFKNEKERAWHNHCENKETLRAYAKCMEKLATEYWDKNCTNDSSLASSRIEWAVNICHDYFNDKLHLKYKQREVEIAEKIKLRLDAEESFPEILKLIDVGSCYNPFINYDNFDVLAIDLCPANDSVFECDFLKVNIGSETIVIKNKVEQLKSDSFDVVTFCFLLEYIPSSELRLDACKNAYDILKAGGLLIISTPDSKHVGANCKIMKCWRYTLAMIGFSRIKYEKNRHMHCMAFRKSQHKDIAARWATLHKEPCMEFAIYIPQDFQEEEENTTSTIKIETSMDDFIQLPFNDIE